MVLAIIPARAGSKSIKNKNIVLLGGIPLIAYSITTAKKCNKIDKVIVSTDSHKIADIAKSYGADVPFLRPAKLATDNSPTILTIKHAIEFLERKGQNYETIIILQPTSPLRKIEDIKKSLKLLNQPNTDSVVSVCIAEHNPYYVMKEIKENYIRPVIEPKQKIYCRQSAPKVYRLNGSIYTVKRDVIMKKNDDITDKTRPLIMPREYSIDIDSKEDLLFAELILKRIRIRRRRENNPGKE
jgi:N-acylneuraminate cytidylyltransferase/CMP-N,N'-diacetyllegionaminic acid synthase